MPLSEPLFLLGVLFILVVMFVPGGIAGTAENLVRRRRTAKGVAAPAEAMDDMDDENDAVEGARL